MSGAPAMDPRAVAVLSCPVCVATLSVADGGLVCPAGHRFDRARQGHVTLLPPGHRPPSGDSAEMVADRVAFLEAAHYAGVQTGRAATGGRGHRRASSRPAEVPRTHRLSSGT